MKTYKSLIFHYVRVLPLCAKLMITYQHVCRKSTLIHRFQYSEAKAKKTTCMKEE